MNQPCVRLPAGQRQVTDGQCVYLKRRVGFPFRDIHLIVSRGIEDQVGIGPG